MKCHPDRAGHRECPQRPNLQVRDETYYFLCRPAVLAGKLLSGRPLYRYKLSDFRPSGWKQTAVRLPIGGLARPGGLSPESIDLLRGLRRWCDEHNVRAAYALPWSYAPPEKVQEFQKQNVQFLLQMVEIIPVLKDPHLGADPVIEHFSDTPLHPNNAGAALHTDELAGRIKNWDLWTAEELRYLESQL